MTSPKLTASQRRELAEYTPEAERRRRERRRELLARHVANGVSVTELAKELGVTRQRVQQILDGRHH